ncbi:MAG: glycoside hydrolase family 3 protein [Clostridia bacterium]|nr:glycoside hydrolase family 3 protein [Clostridia bacterium]
MKKTKKAAALILAAVMLVSLAFPAFARSGKLDEKIASYTRKIAVDIESEGVVLLKNEDNVLPLKGKSVNVFGAGSVVPFYGGAGSGAVTTQDPVDLYEALDTAGIRYNEKLKSLYEKHCKSPTAAASTDNTVINNLLQLALADSSLDEMPVRYLKASVMKQAKEFSDTAIIVISRTSAEGSDLSADTLRLSSEEKALVECVTSAFENVIVLFNTGNIMEMGWLDDYDSIKAAALIWIPGEFGLEGAAKVLSGEVSPSGRLADTVAYNVDDHPSGASFGSIKYDEGGNYVEYLEGIYVGYRYFETFAKDKVQYPFGYGLSYTKFAKSGASFSVKNGKVTARVTVTNTGKCSGKEVVQLYYSAPYKKGGTEKSAICLGAFAKTKLLAPGKSQTLTLTMPVRSMASYDSVKEQAYVLDSGSYKLMLANDIRSPYASYTYTQGERKVYRTDEVTGTKIKNLFDDDDSGSPVLSRAGGKNAFPEAKPLAATDAVKNCDTLPEPVKEGTAPKQGVKYSKTIMLSDVAKDESLWDPFLDQLTVDEMITLAIHSGYETQGVERLGIPATEDNDGPSSLKGRHGLVYTDCGTAYPCETAIACTWNTALAEEMGRGVGKEGADMGEDIWYAPGVNIHRNPRGGRNFEYFSEDPLISGKMGAAIVKGANSEGLVTTVKHFALNDQESHRNGLFVWANEQTMREIYLRAFEYTVKEGKTVGIMSAYNRIGADWCGAKSALLKDLLRKEWGFDGYVISDYSANVTGSGYMSPVLAVYNGNDTMLTGVWIINRPGHEISMRAAYAKDPVGFGKALRESTKNLCKAKMQTKAFTHPEITYDESLIGSLVKISEWNFEFPYAFSLFRYLLNNLAYVVIYAFRFIL